MIGSPTDFSIDLIGILEGIAKASKDARLGAIHPIQEPERARLLAPGIEDTLSGSAEPALLHRRFEASARMHADAIALVGDDPLQQLSYAELDERANALAHRLVAAGVQREEAIALCLPRSPESVVALLGVLKAGAAFVAIDPTYPPERRKLLLADSGARRVICEASLRETFEREGVDTLTPDADRHPEAPPLDPDPEQLAYLLYTSGSTGRPKGVMVSHRNLCHTLEAEHRVLRTRADARVLQFASFSFDASLSEIFSALLHGAELHLPSREALVPGEALAALLRQRRISIAQLPPSVLSVTSEGELPDLEVVVSSGEACSADVVRRWSAGRRFLNVYGPTETTISATSAECAGDATPPPIGRPLAGVGAYVLDRQLRPLGDRIEGELYIGGPGVARGYLADPARTAERFVPDPFASAPGARMYRTGDRVAWREDGQLEFLGRTDAQVKLRGFRIELGEIEATLEGLAGVTDAAVLVHGESADTRQLVAYVVAPAEVTTASLRDRMREVLPEHLVPSAWVRLDALPLTAQGKLDRRALPAPDASERPEWSRAFAEPRGTIETALAEIWSEVLGQPRVGRNDHFFELGGHSLLATQVASRVRTRLGLELPLRALFETPTLGALAAHLEKRQSGAVSPPEGEAIARVSRESSLPVSFAQERLWFLWQLDPKSPAYNLPGAFRLRGRLHAEALARALEEVIRRHEALRTSFRVEDGVAVQCIGEPRLPLRTVELTGLPREQLEREVARRVRNEALEPFDLESGPLVRAVLLRLGDDENVLLLSMHHIVSDGWSTGIFIRELAELYGAFTNGRGSPLPPLTVQYADFAHWQRRRLDGAWVEGELQAWREALAGAPPVLELPTDHPRPAVQRFEAGTIPVALSSSSWARLTGFCQREGVTPFMALLAAYQVVLGRWSEQDDLVVGTPIAGRTRPELEGMIGFFVNTLVLRARLTRGLDFRGLVHQVRDTALAAFAHQELPFEKLVEALQPSRELSHPPLFQVMFSLQNAPPAALELPGLALSPEPVEAAAAKFDLTLSLEESGDELRGALVYNRELFEHETAERFAAHFVRLLEGALTNPTADIHQLPLVDTAEEGRLLREWNRTSRADEVLGSASLAEQFEAQVDRTPDAVAVTHGDAKLTFRELDLRANALAHRLHDLGVGPDVLVGVCLERSIELVVAILGVLKAGGGYVPLDPAYPRERLQVMLEDARAPVLIADPKAASGLRLTGLHVLDPSTTSADASRPHRRSHPDNLAYAIFTSGSTGRPKPVGIRQRAVSNLISALGSRVYERLDPTDPGAAQRVSLNGSVSFDTSVKQVFQLLRGHAIDVTPEEVRFDGPAFLGYLGAQRIDVLDCTPTQLQLLIEAGLLEEPLPLKAVLVGGEAIPPALWSTLRRASQLRFFNVYGPTECTVDATVCELGEAGERPTLGRTLLNVRAHVLDAFGIPTPIGLPGELHLGGTGVARGYLGRPGVTADRFIPDPFAHEPGARLYRTGDRARWRPDGALEFLGRADHQVKVRGHRIELGEVEESLRATPPVRDAVAAAWTYGPGDTRLVAWVVCADPSAFDAAEVRRALASRLPEAMIPAVLVPLAAFPVSPNGKLDRKALPAPNASPTALARSYVAPRSALEQQLARIWEEALGVTGVGAHDHFFERGGHSLLATRVVSRIRSQLEVELPLRTIFEAPVLSSLAARVAEATPTHGGAGGLVLVRADRAAPLPLSFAQQRLWFLDQLEPGSTAYHVTHALRLRGRLDVAALERSLDAIVARHEILRTCFPTAEGRPVQQVLPTGAVRLRRVDLDAHASLEPPIQQLIAEEPPFQLDRGPLFRATLGRIADHDHVLVITMHHIVTDGWSSGVFAAELAEHYRAFSANQSPSAIALPVQYADFALAQRRWLEGGALSAQLDHWKRTLAGAPPAWTFPFDRPRPRVPTHRAGSVSLSLTPERVARLKALASEEGCSLFMVLLAALQTLLARYSGQGDVVVGTPIAGRTQHALEPLIGLFVNTLPLRGRFHGNPTFRELLAQTRETTLAAYAHQDVPFEKLVEALNPPREGGQAPIFQVLLVLQNTPRTTLELPGVSLSPVELAPSRAKFDLSWSLEERDGGIAGVLDFDADLFEESTVERMRDHWDGLLETLVEQPDVPVCRVPLLGEADRGSRLELVDRRLRETGFPPSVDAGAIELAPRRRRHLAPEGEDEAALAALWREVLQVERIGREDDFFELGGHSLLATQLWSRIRARFGVELALRELFDAPVLQAQALRIRAARTNARATGLPVIRRGAGESHAPLSFSQQRLWFLQRLAPQSSAYNLPYPVRLIGTARRVGAGARTSFPGAASRRAAYPLRVDRGSTRSARRAGTCARMAALGSDVIDACGARTPRSRALRSRSPPSLRALAGCSAEADPVPGRRGRALAPPLHAPHRDGWLVVADPVQ